MLQPDAKNRSDNTDGEAETGTEPKPTSALKLILKLNAEQDEIKPRPIWGTSGS